MHKAIKKAISMILAVTLLTAGTFLYVAAGYFDSAAGGHVCDHGFYTFGDKKLIGGVGTYPPYSSRKFWIDSALSNVSSSGTQFSYADLVSLAVMDWRDNTVVQTPINLNYTATQSQSQFEFWKDTTLPTYVLGSTSFWQGYNPVNINSSTGALELNYSWAKISLNTSALNSCFPSSMAAQRKATISHELGHGFGLSHRNNIPSSIMCQSGGGRTASAPSSIDCSTINHLYPNPSYK